MSEFSPPEERPPARGSALVAWCVILVVVVTVFLWQRWRGARVGQDRENGLQRTLLELQGRSLVGAKELGGDGKRLYQQAQPFDRGSFRQRLRFAVLGGELVGPEEALQRLDALADGQADEGEGPSAEDARLREDLRRLYAGYAEKQFDAGKVLAPQERERLRAELGWFGELALAPQGTPDEDAR